MTTDSIRVAGVGSFAERDYLAFVVAGELPVHLWYAQVVAMPNREELLLRLHTYVATMAVAIRSYTHAILREGGAITSSTRHQVMSRKNWSEYPDELKLLVDSAIAATEGWLLVDPFADPDNLDYVALASYARTILEPAPNGRGKGPYQGSNFQYPGPAILDEERGNDRSMGMSQLGLARLALGFYTQTNNKDRLDFSRPVQGWSLRTIEDYLAAFYPNFALRKPGSMQVELLDRRNMAWYPDVFSMHKPTTQVYQVAGEPVGFAVNTGDCDRSYEAFHDVRGDNLMMFHQTPGGLRSGLGPEVGFYVQASESGSYSLGVRAPGSGYRLRAYLYDDENGCLVGTPRSTKNRATFATVTLQAGVKYYLVVDVESWDPPVAERQNHQCWMPPSVVSIKGN